MKQIISVSGRLRLTGGVAALALAAAVAGCGSSKSSTTTSAAAPTTATTATATTATTATTPTTATTATTPTTTTATTPTTATTATTATTSTTSTTSTADNGVSGRSANQILAAATTAVRTASSVHVAGGDGSGTQLDLTVVRGRGGEGTIAQAANDFQIIGVGKTVYLRGSDAFYRQVGGEGAVQLLRGRWLSGPATGQFQSIADLTNMDRLLSNLLRPAGSRITKGSATTIDGQRVITLTGNRSRGSLYVAATGQRLPGRDRR